MIIDADLGPMQTGDLPTIPGTFIQVRWRGCGAVERYVLDNAGRWANVRNQLRHQPFELGHDRIDGFRVIAS